MRPFPPPPHGPGYESGQACTSWEQSLKQSPVGPVTPTVTYSLLIGKMPAELSGDQLHRQRAHHAGVDDRASLSLHPCRRDPGDLRRANLLSDLFNSVDAPSIGVWSSARSVFIAFVLRGPTSLAYSRGPSAPASESLPAPNLPSG